tara:strand:+ start:207 stop:578 length:372 start_codon:yes stop_codon:yes gene_type:complete
MKSQKQFILDTLLPYKEDPTTCAIELGICQYLTEDGRMCAVGKHMKKGTWQTENMDVDSIYDEFGIEKVLKKSALKQGFTIKQWQLIQSYHDKCSTYSSSGLMNNRVEKLEESLNITLTELKF